ncbi:MAG: ABC transporter permease [Microbacterium sp. 71-36]|uniref:carbohydrate ABC transporter permease n=1 Tax=unclassified Microbacterium TaxID=2609290 RepID=UPI00086C1B1A|nr:MULTISPECIES: carbohydrate ABC transporter permease [unclassified Microbacterium]MBN9211472.1 carbohydrate ABC transporter permease [Microbacterium sp.]ODT41344.1 MAG: ABC transporter permease [Microbacterium sp. SCN 71-17]OJV75189.1 MAG: ABC transporter permease [Microbacterium sp. 71-36]
MSTATLPTSSEQLRPRRRPASRSGSVRRIPGTVLIVLLVAIEVLPLLWLLMNSFKSQDEFLNAPTWALPRELNLQNYVDAWVTGNIGQYLGNSVVAVFPALALMLLLGVAAGFVLEVMVFRGRGGILLLFLAGIMVPGQMILLPLFSVYFQAGITGSLWPLIITYTATGLPLTVFMMATYFRAIPREVFEASTLDGASIFRSFFSVALPMARNSIVTVGLVQFFFFWNDLLIALTFTNSSQLRTVQVGLLNFTGQFGATQYGPLFAAICINVFGILAIYLVLNQRIMAGLASGAVKG